MIDRKKRRPGLLIQAMALIALLNSAASSRAELVLRFGLADYSASPGQGLDIPVFLSESGTNILATEGLNSAGLVVSYNVIPQVSAPAQVTDITPTSGVNDLDDFVFTSIVPATGTQPGSAELLFSIVLSDVLKPPAGSSEILLGTFRFVAGSIPGQATLLSTAISSGGPQFFSGTGQILDGMITTAQATLTTTPAPAVPEPLSLVLCVTGLTGVLSHAYLRRLPLRR